MKLLDPIMTAADDKKRGFLIVSEKIRFFISCEETASR